MSSELACLQLIWNTGSRNLLSMNSGRSSWTTGCVLPGLLLPAAQAADLLGVHSSLLNTYQCARLQSTAIANRFRRSWWLFSNESVSEYLAQVALQSYPEYLEIFYAAMQFSMQLCVGLWFSSCPPTTRGPLPAHLRTLARPPLGMLSPVPHPPLLLASPPMGERQRFALALAGYLLLPATSGTLRHWTPAAATWSPGDRNPFGSIRKGSSWFDSGGTPRAAPRPVCGGQPSRPGSRWRLCCTGTYHPLLRSAPGQLPFSPSPQPSSRLGLDGPEEVPGTWASLWLGPSCSLPVCTREPLS